MDRMEQIKEQCDKALCDYYKPEERKQIYHLMKPLFDALYAEFPNKGVNMTKEEQLLRELLWGHHGCDSKYFYGDDGEMQCHNTKHFPLGIDFKRDTIEQIQWKLASPEFKQLIPFPLPDKEKPPVIFEGNGTISRSKYNDIQLLAELWVRWNIKEVTAVEVAHRISKIFPEETEKAWKEHLKSDKDNKPLKALLV